MWGDGQRSEVFTFYFSLASFSSPLPHRLYLHTLLWLSSESDALMFVKSVCSGPRDACHMKELLLSLVSSPLISPCLVTFSDLWLVCIKWRRWKTSNWPSSTWQGDVAQKKKKEQKTKSFWLRDSRAEGEKRDGDGVGGGNFIFLSVDLNVWRKKRTWEHSKLKPNLVTWTESIYWRHKFHKHDHPRQ